MNRVSTVLVVLSLCVGIQTLWAGGQQDNRGRQSVKREDALRQGVSRAQQRQDARLLLRTDSAGVVPGAAARERGDSERGALPDQHPEYRTIFQSVQDGIVSGSVGTFSQFLGSQVHVNLRGGESGYFSANQAHYVLTNYFRTRRVLRFEFTTLGSAGSEPYGTGSAVMSFKGTREQVQVFVSLTLLPFSASGGERWVISQVNIY
jgi:hypothetical protein